jgi:hypothetical protein
MQFEEAKATLGQCTAAAWRNKARQKLGCNKHIRNVNISSMIQIGAMLPKT